jgi:hypothetical protein
MGKVSLEQAQEWVSVNVGTGGGIAYLILTIVVPLSTSLLRTHYWFNVCVLALIGIASGLLGWGVGIILSPIGVQKQGATLLSSAFASFWTGVIVSHIEAITRTLLGLAHGELGQANKIRLIFVAGIFLLATLVTFNSRFPKPEVTG